MIKRHLSLLLLAMAGIMHMVAAEPVISLRFSRTGTDAQSVTVSVVDEAGHAVPGATARLTGASHAFKGTGNAVTAAILCPDVNATTNPTIGLTFTIDGLPQGVAFDCMGLDIHALNGGSGYQENGDNVPRQWNVAAVVGDEPFGSLSDVDIAAGVGSRGSVHKMWEIASTRAVACEGTLTVELTITKGTTNNGCFFGLSEVKLGSVAVEPDPTPGPDDSGAKVYYIQWKNTGANHITEGKDTYLTVAPKNTGKMQFWKLIPSGKTNCYYIKNVVSGRYMGSCNMTPASSSRVTTSATPVEYYVGATAASGEIAGCHYLSSTDCADYANEGAGPRALNKDGASDYVITWQAGTGRPGSYWKLVETTDTFVKPQHTALAKGLNIYFNPCGVKGANYLTSAKVHGEGALGHIVYEAASQPASWHVPYPHDYGQVARGKAFDISIALKNSPSADLKANAYFDWNADGMFETTVPITLSGVAGTARVDVPETAADGPTRMRIRVNSNGLDHADDDVEGFAYDFHLSVVEPQEARTVSIGVNAARRGSATLSGKDSHYAYGTTLTAKATPRGNAAFVCWKEEGVVVSTDAEYTFTVDRNVNLKAYFTPNTDPATGMEPLVEDKTSEVSISIVGGNLVARSEGGVHGMALYSIDAARVAQAEGGTLPIGDIAEGTYIVRVTTPHGYRNVKIYLSK